ncbi:MAG: serine/threonine protein kinase, partial [Thermoanaerobaculia bacterium]|nr:serine/threonine protein kinase [Thermoanaerobaculia bacterium]
LVPLGILAFSLRGVNRSAMREQVERTHSVAVRAIASRIEAQISSRLQLAQSLAANRLLVENPTSPESVGLLTSVLLSQDTVVGIVLRDPLGEIVIRAQLPDNKTAVDRALTTTVEQPVVELAGPPERLILYTVGLAESAGQLQLVERPVWLEGMFKPEELGRDAELSLLDETGRILGSGGSLTLPPKLVALATTGKLGGAQVIALEDGQEVVSAFWYLTSAPWVVVSIQPGEVAESLALALDRRALVAVLLGLVLAALGVAGAYSSIVRPVRGILQAQRELEGKAEEGQPVGSELNQLKVSFEQLRTKVRDKKELGRVFLGRYQVLEILGEGAMGTVFRGLDPKLQRSVALKTIHLDRAGKDERREKLVTSLLSEAVAAARFSHSNIVSIYDVEDSSDVAYVAMELVEGQGVENLLWERGSLAPSLAVPIALAVARALEAAHDLGMVHRDIKPANVLLGFDGSIKVTDFGIAGYLGEMKAGSGSIFGTPGYVPPEAIEGKGYEARSDLFSLGVLLYQMVTGVHPFQGTGVREILLTTLTREPRPPSAINPEVTPELEELIRGLLAKKPEYRPEVTDVIHTLEGMMREGEWHWSYVAGPEAPPALGATEMTLEAQWIDTMEFNAAKHGQQARPVG